MAANDQVEIGSDEAIQLFGAIPEQIMHALITDGLPWEKRGESIFVDRITYVYMWARYGNQKARSMFMGLMTDIRSGRGREGDVPDPSPHDREFDFEGYVQEELTKKEGVSVVSERPIIG